MAETLHQTLRGALLNNSFDENSLNKSLDKSHDNSFSVLCEMEKSLIDYKCLYYENKNKKVADNDTNQSIEFGELFINETGYASFNAEIELLDVSGRKEFHNYYYDENGNIYNGNKCVYLSPNIFKYTKCTSTFPYALQIVNDDINANENQINKKKIINNIDGDINNIKYVVDTKTYLSLIQPKLTRIDGSYITPLIISNIPSIIKKIPVLIIDKHVIWDYKIKLNDNGSSTFILPFKSDFVIDPILSHKKDTEYRNYTVFKDHSIQIILIDNFTPIISYNYKITNIVNYNSSVNFNELDYIDIKLDKINYKTNESGILFCSLYFPVTGTGWKLGSQLCKLEYKNNCYRIYYDKNEFVSQGLNLTNESTKINYFIIQPIYFNNLYEYKNTNNSNIIETIYDTKKDSWVPKLSLILNNKNENYNLPIPIENCILMKSSSLTNSYEIISSTKNLKLRYPNIYEITDNSILSEDTSYKLYYFYKKNNNYRYENIFNFFNIFLKIYFKNHKYLPDKDNKIENIYNLLYFPNSYSSELNKMFENVFNYSYYIHKYTEHDYVKNYLSEKDNLEKYPIEYKIDKFKKWINIKPDVLRDYVKEQNKINVSYYVFTDKIDLTERMRYDTFTETGTNDFFLSMPSFLTIKDLINELNKKKNNGSLIDGECYRVEETHHYYKCIVNNNYSLLDNGAYTNTIFSEPYYVFRLHSKESFPKPLHVRVFVDGLFVNKVYQERVNFDDYVYIPHSAFSNTKDITKQHFIEFEILKEYTFEKSFNFTSLNDSVEISLPKPDKNIYPTINDLYFISYSDDIYEPYTIYDKELFKITSIYDKGEYPVSSKPKLKKIYPNKSLMLEDLKNNPSSFIDGNLYGTKNDDHFYLYKNIIVYESMELLNSDAKVDLLSESRFYRIKNGSNIYRYNNRSLLDVGKYDSNFIDLGLYTLIEPIDFANMNKFRIQPESLNVVNKDINIKISKVPMKTNLIVEEISNPDENGQGIVEIAIQSNLDYLTNDYIRIFKNGRLIPKGRYIFVSLYNLSKIKLLDPCSIGDLIYIDITPYKYKEIYYQKELINPIINLSNYINKPFDISYYDVYLNGRKLNINNVIQLSDYDITLVNIKSLYNLQIFEKERDYEYFGIDQKEIENHFNFNDILDSSILNDNDKSEYLLTLIDENKHKDLIIYPNTNDEEILDFSDLRSFIDVNDFYYNELLPLTYYNPSMTQVNEKYIETYYNTINKKFNVIPYKDSNLNRAKYYVNVLLLNPDTIIENKGNNDQLCIYPIGHLGNGYSFKTSDVDASTLKVVDDTIEVLNYNEIKFSDAINYVNDVQIGDNIYIGELSDDILRTEISIPVENEGDLSSGGDLLSVATLGTAILGYAILGTY